MTRQVIKLGSSSIASQDGERRSENLMAARGLDAIERIFGASDPLTPNLRGAGLALVDRVAPLKQLFASIAAGRAARRAVSVSSRVARR